MVQQEPSPEDDHSGSGGDRPREAVRSRLTGPPGLTGGLGQQGPGLLRTGRVRELGNCPLFTREEMDDIVCEVSAVVMPDYVPSECERCLSSSACSWYRMERK